MGDPRKKSPHQKKNKNGGETRLLSVNFSVEEEKEGRKGREGGGKMIKTSVGRGKPKAEENLSHKKKKKRKGEITEAGGN